MAYLKIGENIFLKSDLFENQKLAKSDVNKKILKNIYLKSSKRINV